MRAFLLHLDAPPKSWSKSVAGAEASSWRIAYAAGQANIVGALADEPSRAELLALLARAREAIEESQRHWGALVGLVGDRKLQRQQREVLQLLDAIRERVEIARERRG